MENLKIQTIASINTLIGSVRTRVQYSTGSLHTKDDVNSLFRDFENTLIYELGQLFDNAPVVDSDKEFTLDEVLDVIEGIDYSDYATADVGSAEFELSYNNVVELTSCDIEYDEQGLYSHIDKTLRAMLNKKLMLLEPTTEVVENTIS